MFHYRLQKRVLASDCELPFLSPAATSAEPGIVMRLSTVAAPPAGRTTSWYRTDTIVMHKCEEEELILAFDDGTRFVIGAKGRTIDLLSAPASYTAGDIAAYALGPVIAIALHLQGAVLLHAASVVLREKAVLFAGAAGAGKSTIAAILHREGYTLLADDITEITREEPHAALPSLPAVRLWPDVLDALYGSAEAFPDRAPSWDKKMVRVAAVDDAREIAAVLFLDPARRGASPALAHLPPREGWQRLIAHSYTARLPDPEMSRIIFEVTSALADRIPMYTFAPPSLATSGGLGAFLESELR